MTNQVPTFGYDPIVAGAPPWLTLPLILIAVAALFVLLLIWTGIRSAHRRHAAERELEENGQGYREGGPPPPEPVGVPMSPPVAPAPPPVADSPAPATAPVTEPVSVEPAPEPAPEYEPAPEPEPVAEAPSEPQAPSAPPVADEPIAAAAPMEASPASEAATPAPEPAPAHDDLTQMKGVGPRLAERLNALGVTSFAQLAALSSEEADALDARLGDFRGRMARDRWIEQASLLASGDIAAYEEKFGKL